MKAIQSASIATEISGVDCHQSGSSCKLTWKAATGGVIICFSQGFKPWPDIKEITGMLTDAQVRTLISTGEINAGQDVLLEYMTATMITAKMACFDFNARAKFALPLKIQLFSVSADGTTVYVPSGTANRRIVPASVALRLEPAPLFKKGKKITVSGANINNFADGFLCYTVPGAPNDSSGFPMEYPIPNSALTAGYLLQLDCNFNVDVARKWSDLVNLTKTEANK